MKPFKRWWYFFYTNKCIMKFSWCRIITIVLYSFPNPFSINLFVIPLFTISSLCYTFHAFGWDTHVPIVLYFVIVFTSSSISKKWRISIWCALGVSSSFAVVLFPLFLPITLIWSPIVPCFFPLLYGFPPCNNVSLYIGGPFCLLFLVSWT